MRASSITVAVLFFAIAVCYAGVKRQPILSFSLVATNEVFVAQPEAGFTLKITKDITGWEADVSRSKKCEFLLYPTADWHGACPCQLSAWSHARKYFPDERTIRVRGYRRWVRVRLIEAQVSGERGSEVFTGGRCEIYWQRDG